MIGNRVFSTLAPVANGAQVETHVLPAAFAYTLYGLDFSPFIDGQDPNLGASVGKKQLKRRIKIIRGYADWIRTFGCSAGLERAGGMAHNFGFKAAIGAWLGRDQSANELEVTNLIDVIKAGDADLAIVGSEVLRRGDLSEDQLIAYINRVKREARGIPVSTADTYAELLAHPRVLSVVDVVLSNYYPYWEGIKIDTAIAALHGWHAQVVTAAAGKPVIVSETGWPSCGNVVGQAVPSPENAAFYFLNFISWARANNVMYFYFSALDETWKATYEGPQGACWGVFDKDGNLKPRMQDVFDGNTMPDNWSGNPGGPGNPAIEFTYVPPYGSFNDLRGQVSHVKPSDYKVAVLIYVLGYWNKPTFANPLTAIRSDGTWTCDITTGGHDENATRIVAFLVRNGYSPPLLQGDSTLPPELDQNSVARVEAVRIP